MVMNLKQALEYYGISRAGLYRAIKKGEIKSIKVGRFRRYLKH